MRELHPGAAARGLSGRPVADAIRIGDPAIEIRLRRNARARRMVLRVAQAGRGPTLTLPPGVPIAQARAFLSDQEGWLRRHLAARPGGARRWATARCCRSGTRTLTIARRRPGAAIVLRGRRARGAGAGRRGMRSRVAAWLREEARRACVAAVDAARGARWGCGRGGSACAIRARAGGPARRAGDLMFSWRLIMAPAAVLDYVVAHEVAHLAEMNHSPRFWAVVRRLCPDYRGAARLAAAERRRRCTRRDFGTAPA